MRTQSYIHGWDFAPESDFTLSDASLITAKQRGLVSLKPQRRPVKLPGRSIAYFPIADDIFARTRAFSPGALVSWDFIEIRGTLPKDLNGDSPTTLSARIHDGTNSLYWDGAAWVVAGAGNWNTEEDVNANLSAYTGASLAVEVRLRTTDENLSPSLVCVLVRWTGTPVSTLDEFLYNGIVALLDDNIRPTTLWVEPGNGTTTMEVGPTVGDTDYRVTDVLAVYDLTADPNLATNLLTDYTGTTVTLSSAIPTTNKAYMIVEYRPTIAVTTSSDFNIGARVPAIWITDVIPGPRKQVGSTGPEVIDRTLPVPAGTAFPTPIPFRDVEFQYAIIAPTSRDLLALSEAMNGWVTTFGTVRAPALDFATSLRPGIVPTWDTTTTDEDDTRLATGTFILKNVPVFGDSQASASNSANTRGTTRVGPVDAGDPDFPGVGYGVARVNVTLRTEQGGDETITVTE